ncbi:MAG TPA: DUF5915 domain-containing protein, partial [Actinomycetota bacterium]|nr:DUF5915 domain-containing protein [Actinomycetota bacterium]
RVVSLGLQAREQAKAKVRQPLARVWVEGADVPASLHVMVLEELNVKSIEHGSPGDAQVASASEGGVTAHLDTEITSELRAEGNARELVRAVQNLRKNSGLAVADRISLTLDVSEDLWTALEPHREWIAAEVLATSFERGSSGSPLGKADVKLDGNKIPFAIERV